ncbi:MAG: hypothetical protein HEQ34_13100 [Sphingorhabdus sp.]|uniref:hypothetical protein n=1 Tax=Sphingorhabdus sp. TaxID=1902408 RepID=UPI0025DCCCC9|nr:hypothetical protein [Sphingorhabdus sp.]MCO4092870.1 hypothetical protein [Sphingorhabdus sp.]
MKFLATLFICCVILAAAKATIVILAIAILFALVWGAIFRPAQTYGFIATCFIVSLFSRYPGWCLAAIVLVAVVTALRTTTTEATNQS